jgi:REP element-mobilizing transposase RayT
MQPYTRILMHCVWATWDRRALVDTSIEKRVYSAIATRCRDLRCVPLALGGTDDHIHLLVSLHATVSVAELVKEVKGFSSYLMTHQVRPSMFFRWQGSYGAFSVGHASADIVVEYIRNQRRHHREGTVRPEWEQTGEDRSQYGRDVGEGRRLIK